MLEVRGNESTRVEYSQWADLDEILSMEGMLTRRVVRADGRKGGSRKVFAQLQAGRLSLFRGRANLASPESELDLAQVRLVRPLGATRGKAAVDFEVVMKDKSAVHFRVPRADMLHAWVSALQGYRRQVHARLGLDGGAHEPVDAAPPAAHHPRERPRTTLLTGAVAAALFSEEEDEDDALEPPESLRAQITDLEAQNSALQVRLTSALAENSQLLGLLRSRDLDLSKSTSDTLLSDAEDYFDKMLKEKEDDVEKRLREKEDDVEKRLKEKEEDVERMLREKEKDVDKRLREKEDAVEISLKEKEDTVERMLKEKEEAVGKTVLVKDQVETVEETVEETVNPSRRELSSSLHVVEGNAVQSSSLHVVEGNAVEPGAMKRPAIVVYIVAVFMVLSLFEMVLR